MAERLYTLAQVAELLGVNPETVQGWVQSGWLQGEMLPGDNLRVSEAGLVRFLRDRGIDLREVFVAAMAHEAARRRREDASAARAVLPAATARQVPPAVLEPPSADETREEAPAAPTAPAAEQVPAAAAPDAEAPEAAPAVRRLASIGSDAAGRLAEAVLKDALARQAEAIHLEPQADGLSLFLRVNGILHEKPNFRSRLPRGLGPQLLARLKSLAGLSGGASHTGGFEALLNGKPQTFRVATCPTPRGERLVVRLGAGARPLPLEALGILDQDLETVRGALAEPSGLVLVAGPPRSGRTTTLRALTLAADPSSRKVIAVGDAEALDIPGVDRLAVDAQDGPALASAIRMAADQQVDVIVVDAICGSQPAAAAVRAALDGHLVLAAVTSRDRRPDPCLLLGPGVEALALASVLLAVIQQRVVRTVCRRCRRQVQPGPAALEALGRGAAEAGPVWRGTGCAACLHTGYGGRTGLFSILRMDERLASLVRRGADPDVIYRAALEAGLKSLREVGREKVREGLTTAEEVLRALGPA